MIDQKKRRGPFHDQDGDISMMRINVFVGLILTGLCVLTGLVVVVTDELANHPAGQGYALVALGVGIYTSGSIAKAIQAGAEAKMAAAIRSVPPINPTVAGSVPV